MNKSRVLHRVFKFKFIGLNISIDDFESTIIESDPVTLHVFTIYIEK